MSSARRDTLSDMDERWRQTEHLWERIIWARLQANFERKKEAADALSIKPPTYRSYERPVEKDGRVPPLAELQKIARKFRINWVWLASGRGSPYDAGVTHGDLFERLAERLDSVPEEKREDAERAVFGVLDSFAKRA